MFIWSHDPWSCTVVLAVFHLCIPIILEQTMGEIQSGSSNTILLKVWFLGRLFTLGLHWIDCKLKGCNFKMKSEYFLLTIFSIVCFDSRHCQQILTMILLNEKLYYRRYVHLFGLLLRGNIWRMFKVIQLYLSPSE